MNIETDVLCSTLRLVRMYTIIDNETIEQRLLNVGQAHAMNEEGSADNDLQRLLENMLRVSKEVAGEHLARLTPRTLSQRYRLWRHSDETKSRREAEVSLWRTRQSEPLSALKARLAIHHLPETVVVAEQNMDIMTTALVKLDTSSWLTTGECRLSTIHFQGCEVRRRENPGDPHLDLVYHYDDGSELLIDANAEIIDEIPCGSETHRLFISEDAALAAMRSRLADSVAHLSDQRVYDFSKQQFGERRSSALLDSGLLRELKDEH